MFPTVWLLYSLTGAAREWVEEHIAYESWQQFGSAIAIEHGYVQAVVEGMIADGLVPEKDFDLIPG